MIRNNNSLLLLFEDAGIAGFYFGFCLIRFWICGYVKYCSVYSIHKKQ